MRSGVTPGCFSTGAEVYGGDTMAAHTMSDDVVSVVGADPGGAESSP